MVCYAKAELIKKIVNEMNVIIKKALRCIHYTRFNKSVNNLKRTKKKEPLLKVYSRYTEISHFFFSFLFLYLNFFVLFLFID